MGFYFTIVFAASRAASIHDQTMTDFDATEEAHARRFKRCDARVRKPFTIMPSGAVKHRSPFCRNRPVKGGTRCKFHGSGRPWARL